MVQTSYPAECLLGSAQLAGFYIPGLLPVCVTAPGSADCLRGSAQHAGLYIPGLLPGCTTCTWFPDSLVLLKAYPAQLSLMVLTYQGCYHCVLQHSVETASPRPVPWPRLPELGVRWLLFCQGCYYYVQLASGCDRSAVSCSWTRAARDCYSSLRLLSPQGWNRSKLAGLPREIARRLLEQVRGRRHTPCYHEGSYHTRFNMRRWLEP